MKARRPNIVIRGRGASSEPSAAGPVPPAAPPVVPPVLEYGPVSGAARVEHRGSAAEHRGRHVRTQTRRRGRQALLGAASAVAVVGLFGSGLSDQATAAGPPGAARGGTGTASAAAGTAAGTAGAGSAGVARPSSAEVPAAGPRGSAGGRDRAGSPLVVGYFVQWGIYARQYPVKSVDTSGQASWLTHLNYAFGDVDASGRCASADPWADVDRPVPASESVDGIADEPGQPVAGNFNQLRKLKQKHPDLRVLISLGGWTLSKNFSHAARTRASRETLVRSCIETFLDAGRGAVFDGFDLDWEWPGSPGAAGTVARPEDKRNYTLLVAEFRRRLDALERERGRTYLLSALLPANPAALDAGFEVRALARHLDHVTVQGYDLHGTWERTTNHQSALFAPTSSPTTPDFSVARSLAAVVQRGAPAPKVVMGVPFYGQGWTGVGATNEGLFQPAAAPAKGRFGSGVADYEEIATLVVKGAKVYRDRDARFAWVYDGTAFWTFDDPWVLREKARHVRANGFGGVMIWSLDGDDPRGTLTRSLARALAAR